MSTSDAMPELADHLPYPLGCRILHFKPHSRIERHRSPWAELNFAISGIMEIQIEGVLYLSPPQYAIWIPPNVAHCCENEGEVHYACIEIPAGACDGLPDTPCTLEISPVMRAILADFEQRAVTYPSAPQDRRMAQVVIDQTRQARVFASYLPATDHAVLAPILLALQRNPGDKHGAAHWAATAGITERTLLRHCQQHLGMTFNEWRQRMRVVSALGLLDEGLPVQTVARQLGYGSPSAFIAMFQRLTGASPDSVRKRRVARLPTPTGKSRRDYA